jgi:dihydropyrimidine dehydrogenase (NAD+) subunit PreT
VRILYRRTEEHISAFDLEYQHAKQEGVVFQWLTQPVAVHSSDGRLESLECVSMQMDAEGQASPIAGSNVRIACDLILPAIGQSPLLEMLSQVRDLKLDGGIVVADRKTGQTSNPKYFAAGDCANGGREVVDAVAEGKRAGIAIANRLEAVHVE